MLKQNHKNIILQWIRPISPLYPSVTVLLWLMKENSFRWLQIATQNCNTKVLMANTFLKSTAVTSGRKPMNWIACGWQDSTSLGNGEFASSILWMLRPLAVNWLWAGLLTGCSVWSSAQINKVSATDWPVAVQFETAFEIFYNWARQQVLCVASERDGWTCPVSGWPTANCLWPDTPVIQIIRFASTASLYNACVQTGEQVIGDSSIQFTEKMNNWITQQEARGSTCKGCYSNIIQRSLQFNSLYLQENVWIMWKKHVIRNAHTLTT